MRDTVSRDTVDEKEKHEKLTVDMYKLTQTTHLLRVTANAVTNGDLVWLQVVAVGGEIAVVQGKLMAAPVFVQRGGVGLCERPLLHVLRPTRIVAVRTVIDQRIIPGSNGGCGMYSMQRVSWPQNLSDCLFHFFSVAVFLVVFLLKVCTNDPPHGPALC